MNRLQTPAIGWCAPLDQAARVEAMGYDFIEVALGPLRLEDDAAFASAKTAIRATSLPRPIYSRCLPLGLMVVGPDVDGARLRRYFARVGELMALGGGDLLVFGAGWSRQVPDGWSRDVAHRQFTEMLGWCTDALSAYRITVALESQNRAETNFMTSLGEAVAMADAVGRPDVGVITDTYHLHAEDEPLSAVTAAFPHLRHVHLSDTDRQLPGDGRYDFAACFRHLRALGYNHRLSIEMMREVTDDEMRRGLTFVRERWGDSNGPAA